MVQQSVRPARGGWRDEETALLFSCVEQAEREGRPLRQAFQQTADALGRRPNSIRNYYYARLGDTPDQPRRKPAFELFTPDEVEALMREVLMARGRGESVRACVTRLSEGDPKRMLRLQNKYRSTLKSRPELVARLTQELHESGAPCPADAGVRVAPTGRLGRMAEELEIKCEQLGEPLLPVLLASLDRLLARAGSQQSAATVEHLQERLLASRRECDRLKVERDLLKMALEDAGALPPASEPTPTPEPSPTPTPDSFPGDIPQA